MSDRPLEGIRVLAMEQVAALPFATRHLADLGAEVIRVQSHRRPVEPLAFRPDRYRSKRQLSLDLASDGAPEAFLRLAANCDVVAQNFTPRVVRRFGIDYEGVRVVNERVVYVSLSGFGQTGPWSPRPLYGAGAEASSGHNLMIGPPDEAPGRPGTTVYSDNVCGLNIVFAVLAALDERDRTGRGQHIDISLYETAVSQLGPVIGEYGFGARPERIANHDRRYVMHDVFEAGPADVERYIAISATEDQLPAVARALGLDTASPEAVAAAVVARPAEESVEALRHAGVAAAVVSDSADQSADEHLWARGYFGVIDEPIAELEPPIPFAGPPWGGGASIPMTAPKPVGADSREVLREVAGMTDQEIDALAASGAIGDPGPPVHRPRPETYQAAIEVGEISRVDEQHDGWRRHWRGPQRANDGVREAVAADGDE